MSDIARYAQARAAQDQEFADGLEAGYEEFKFRDWAASLNAIRIVIR